MSLSILSSLFTKKELPFSLKEGERNNRKKKEEGVRARSLRKRRREKRGE